MTGGTALSEFYLHHRLSEDIDLFCEKNEVDQKQVEAYLKKISPILEVVRIERSTFLGLHSYILNFKDKSKLKVDFSYYPFPRIGNGIFFKKLPVDDIHDIAANKLHTIFMQPRSRDYIDLYFIFKTQKYNLNKLIIDAKTKFDWHIDPLTLAGQFLRVKDITDFPTMLIPFNRTEMEKFYLDLVNSLKNQILTK